MIASFSFNSKAKLERIEILVICHHNQPDFNTNRLKYFIKLKTLYIGASLIQKFQNKLPKLDHLEVSLFCSNEFKNLKKCRTILTFQFINITQTQLRSIKSDFFSDLSSIQLIDLRRNHLHSIERFLFHSNEHVKIFLYKNLWNCTRNLKWIATNDARFEIVDRPMLNCSDLKYRGRPMMTVMTVKLALYKTCREDYPDLKNCSCHMSYLRLDEETNEYQPMFSVNCSANGFLNFPRKLPENTTTLFITHNKISSLNMLCTRNSTYNNVHDIYLDYNEINDASVLDNCEWFSNFRVLSLKGNLLERIPNYAFRNSFEKSQHAMKLYLSENPWLCNCRLQPRLLKLCQKYELITDQKQIRCLSDKNEPDIYGRLLMELTKNDVCKDDRFPLNPYEIMSIVFLVLIFLLFINLLYDYYLYKNYGKLPWIVLNTSFF